MTMLLNSFLAYQAKLVHHLMLPSSSQQDPLHLVFKIFRVSPCIKVSCDTLSLCKDWHWARFEEDDRETDITSTIAGPNSQTQVSDGKAITKDGLGVASRFVQTLLKRLPSCVDTNPVKVAFSIAKVIIEIKDVGCCLRILGNWLTIILGGRR